MSTSKYSLKTKKQVFDEGIDYIYDPYVVREEDEEKFCDFATQREWSRIRQTPDHKNTAAIRRIIGTTLAVIAPIA